MARILLFGIVAIAIFVIAPRVGATRSVTVDPNQTASSKPDSASPLLARTVFDADLEDVDSEDVADRRGENVENGNVEERRNDANDWAEDN